MQKPLSSLLESAHLSNNSKVIGASSYLEFEFLVTIQLKRALFLLTSIASSSDISLIKLINSTITSTKLIIVVLHSNNTTSSPSFMIMFLFYHNYHLHIYYVESQF
jgi:hypothetical protein